MILYNINGTEKETADKIIQVLDNYEENYAESELVTEKIGDVIWKFFDYKQKENPVEFATKMMKDMAAKEEATKNETASQLCVRLNSKLAGIEKGEYDDAGKTDIDNVNKRINMIREIRTEIKDNAGKYTDKNSKESLSWTLGTVIAKLELMKHVREHMGWAITGYGEVTDEAVNNEIREMLK